MAWHLDSLVDLTQLSSKMPNNYLQKCSCFNLSVIIFCYIKITSVPWVSLSGLSVASCICSVWP